MADKSEERSARPVELKQFAIDPASVQLLKHAYCLQNRLVILGSVDCKAGTPVTVGFVEPGNAALVAEVATVLGRPVRAVQLNAFEINKALEAGFLLPPSGREPARLTLKPPRELSFDPNTPAATILSEVLARGVQIGASDIHLESYEDDIDVRVRVDGILHHVNTARGRDLAHRDPAGGAVPAHRRRPRLRRPARALKRLSMLSAALAGTVRRLPGPGPCRGRRPRGRAGCRRMEHALVVEPDPSMQMILFQPRVVSFCWW